jgi:hypothetical protein
MLFFLRHKQKFAIAVFTGSVEGLKAVRFHSFNHFVLAKTVKAQFNVLDLKYSYHLMFSFEDPKGARSRVVC